MREFCSAILCAVSFCAIGNLALAGSSMFSAEQLADLKAAGRDVIAPEYLPAGYGVAKIVVDRKHLETPSSAILFTGPKNTCFVVEMGTEVGDMIVEDGKGEIIEPTSEIHNPTLGVAAFWNSKEYLGTDWFPLHRDAAYCVKGDIDRSIFSRDKTAVRVCKNRMEGNELAKVAVSLAVLIHK